MDQPSLQGSCRPVPDVGLLPMDGLLRLLLFRYVDSQDTQDNKIGDRQTTTSSLAGVWEGS